MAQDPKDNVEFKDGGEVNIKTAGKLQYAGTAVTSTATELNLLDGVTATTAELNILDGVTATASEINQHCDESANVETSAAANTLTAAESGKTIFLNSTTGFATTLPAKAAGLRFKFIVSTANTTTNLTIVPNASDDNTVQGCVIVNGASVDGADEGSINLVANSTSVGDWVEVINDGTDWFATGVVSDAGGLTFTT